MNLLPIVAASLLVASLVFPGTTSAHNINLERAQEWARDYAREVRRESKGKYTHYTTDCYKLFQGHNHYVRCLIEYDDDDQARDANWRACRETIDVFLQPHKSGERFDYYIKHYSGQCGSKKLRGVTPRNGS